MLNKNNLSCYKGVNRLFYTTVPPCPLFDNGAETPTLVIKHAVAVDSQVAQQHSNILFRVPRDNDRAGKKVAASISQRFGIDSVRKSGALAILEWGGGGGGGKGVGHAHRAK